MKLSFLCLLFCLGGPMLAHGQGTSVLQSGMVTPRHLSMWTTNGVIQDAGPALGGPAGANPAELGITSTGQPFCITSAPITGPYYQLCFGAAAAGGGLITFNAFGGAPAMPLNCIINGATVSNCLNPAAASVQGPSTTTVDEVASWANTTGTMLRQGAARATDSMTTAINADGSALEGRSSSSASANQIYQMTTSFRPLNSYDAVRGTAIATTGTTTTNTTGIAGYVLDNAVASGNAQNATAVFGVNVNGVAGAQSWGLNLVSTDNTSYATAAPAGMQLKVMEGNPNVMRTDTTGWGLGLLGASLAQPAVFFPAIWIGPLGTGIHWTDGLEIADGSTNPNAIYVGSTTFPCPSGCDGSFVNFGFYNSSGTHKQYALVATGNPSALNVLAPDTSLAGFNIGGGGNPMSLIVSGTSSGVGGGANMFFKNGSTIIGGMGNPSINGGTAYAPNLQIFSAPGNAMLFASSSGYIFQTGLTQGTPVTFACFDASAHLVSSATAC